MYSNLVKLFAVCSIKIGCCLILPFEIHGAEQPRSNATCIACHGDTGVSSNDLWPNIAGQKRGYLFEQLNAFKSGARVNSLMSPIAQTLSESDMKELSEYYSSLVQRVYP